MGEILRSLIKKKYINEDDILSIELNKGVVQKITNVHIEYKNLRLEMPLNDYLLFCELIISAKRKLDEYK
tara:strand:- start:305 stop:514 length:210 start_codon:yes stop_codon:yes gene_type:complete